METETEQRRGDDQGEHDNKEDGEDEGGKRGATGRGDGYHTATTTLSSMTQDHRATKALRTTRPTTTRSGTGTSR
jgi:hypothetical protein